MNQNIPYEVAQQSATLIAASITATSAGSATTLMTTDKQRCLLSVVSALNQPVIVTWNGEYLHYLAIGAAAILDVASDGGYFGASKALGVYYVSASPTTGSLYAMAI